MLLFFAKKYLIMLINILIMLAYASVYEITYYVRNYVGIIIRQPLICYASRRHDVTLTCAPCYDDNHCLVTTTINNCRLLLPSYDDHCLVTNNTRNNSQLVTAVLKNNA